MKTWYYICLTTFSWASLAVVDEKAFLAVELSAKNASERSAIANLIHIDSVSDDRVYSVVSPSDWQRLIKKLSPQIIAAEVVGEKLSRDFEALAGVVDFPDGEGAFHTYDEMIASLRQLERNYPGQASVFSIGLSVQAKDIWAIKISDPATQNINNDKPAILYMATHHAREHVSTEMPILFAKNILASLATDNEIANLLSKVDIYLIPMVNPDGAMHDIEGQSYKYWRKNRRQNNSTTYGVDLNRNYGFGWGTGGSSSSPSSDVYMGSAPFSEPETRAIRDFMTSHRNISIALSFHTYSELILYPWGGRSDGIGGQDEAIFKKMAADMAAMNKYKPMQSSELYIASGDTCDWAYGELSVYCFTFELSPSSMWGGGFYPGASVIDQVFDDNWGPMLYLANLAHNPALVLSRGE